MNWCCWELPLFPQKNLLQRTNLTALTVRLADVIKAKVLTMVVSIFIQLHEMRLLPARSEIYSCIADHRLCHVIPFNLLLIIWVIVVILCLWTLYLFSSIHMEFFAALANYYFDITETAFHPRRPVLHCTDNHHRNYCDLFVVSFACLCRLNFKQLILMPSTLSYNVHRLLISNHWKKNHLILHLPPVTLNCKRKIHSK